MAVRPPKKLDRQALWNYALRALGGRAMTSGELSVRLRRRAERVADADEVLVQLKDHGYLNDRRFAENFTAARLENQGLGKQRVLRDLRQHRVAPSLAEKAVQDAYASTDEVALIEDYLRRKYRNVDLRKQLSDPSKLASAFRRLRYAGFSAGNSIRVLKRFSEQAGELEESEEDSPGPE